MLLFLAPLSLDKSVLLKSNHNTRILNTVWEERRRKRNKNKKNTLNIRKGNLTWREKMVYLSKDQWPMFHQSPLNMCASGPPRMASELELLDEAVLGSSCSMTVAIAVPLPELARRDMTSPPLVAAGEGETK